MIQQTMRIRNSRAIRTLVVFFYFLLVMGCNQRGAEPNSKAEEQKLIKELEKQAGFFLPKDVELLKYMDDIGRDGSDGYFSWVLFSPTEITTMPIIQKPYINGYRDASLDSSVKLIQVMTSKRKIKQPQSAFASYWKANGYEFNVILVRTPEGDYMVVQRFWIGGTPPKSLKTKNPSSSESQIHQDEQTPTK